MSGPAMLVISCAFFAAACRASIENPTLAEYPHLGRYYSQTGQHALAAATYRAMIARTPDTREAEEGWLDLGECHRQLMLNARADLAKAKAAGAPKAEIADLEGRIASNMNQALAAYQAVLARFPASRAEAIIGTGNVYAAFGAERAGEARREYARVIDGYPEEAGRAQVLTGDLLASADDAEGAKAAYQKAVALFPEVASLAMLRYADLVSAEEAFGEAAESYGAIADGMGVDGAYNHKFHLIGDVMERAIAGRGRAERALGNKANELEGYAAAASRYDGTQAGVAARMASAEALDYYGGIEEAGGALEAIVSRFPKSVWAPRARMRLASMRGASARAAEIYRGIADAYPQGIFWVEAQMALADTWWRIAEREEDPDKKKEMRVKARAACDEIVARYPSCPEAARAREFLSAHPAP